jgi:hypothetical protein
MGEVIYSPYETPRIIYDETRRGASWVTRGFLEHLATLYRDARVWPIWGAADRLGGIGVDLSLTPLGADYQGWDYRAQGEHLARLVAAAAESPRPLVVRLMSSVRLRR